MTLSEKLHALVFKGLESYDFGDVLYSFSEMLRISGGRSGRTAFLRLCAKCVVRPERFLLSRDSAPVLLAFVSASANQRADIRNIRTNVLSLGVPMRTLDARPGFFPSVGDAIPAVVHLFSWFRTLRSADVSREWIVPVLDRLLALWRFDRFCSRNVPFEQLKLATVFYDSEPLHHLLVRKCQQRKVATATLQHGVILAPREGARDNIDFAGIELLGSCADTFLAWNEFTVSEGVKAGVDKRRFTIVGSSRTLGNRADGRILQKSDGRFGVLLDGAFTEENNPRLVEIATEFARRRRVRFEVRYHPRFRGDEYDAILPPEALRPKRGEMLRNWCSRQDFVLAASSTAVMEVLDFGVPVYLFSSGGVKEKYRDVDVPKFGLASDLESLLESDKTGCIQEFLRKQLLFKGDSTRAYRGFLLSFST